MLGFDNWESLIYLLSMIGVSVLANSSGKPLAGNEKKFYLMKKISWGLIVLSMAYFTITFPYAGNYYNFSNKSEYPAELTSNTETKYIQEHHQRIEDLEKEVERTREEVRAIRDRLSLMLQILMYGIIFYGCNQIFKSKNRELEEIDKDKVLNL
jgi:predicted transcriptional regulator